MLAPSHFNTSKNGRKTLLKAYGQLCAIDYMSKGVASLVAASYEGALKETLMPVLLLASLCVWITRLPCGLHHRPRFPASLANPRRSS